MSEFPLNEATVCEFIGAPAPAAPSNPPGARSKRPANEVKFLRRPNHALWQLGRALRQPKLAGHTAETVRAWLNGMLHYDPDEVTWRLAPEIEEHLPDECQRSLLRATLLLVLACAEDASQREKYVEAAGREYAGPMGACSADAAPDELGQHVARKTFDRLIEPYPDYDPLPAQTRVLSVVTGGGSGNSHLLAVEPDGPGAAPAAPYFDPIRLGVLNFGAPGDENFLTASVREAWLAYRADLGRAAPRALWWGWLSVQDAGIATLSGPSAGAAFWAAFRSAHHNEPLDRTVAVSAALEFRDGAYRPVPVGGPEEKIAAAERVRVRTVVFAGPPPS